MKILLQFFIVLMFFISCSKSKDKDIIENDNFQKKENWEAFNINLYSGFENAVGYYGAVSDGRYIYYSPCRDYNNFHGRVLRYDTNRDFYSIESYNLYDAGNVEGMDTKGYSGVVYAKDYIYFVPYSTNSERHARVLRYDINSDFSKQESWSAYDVSEIEGIFKNTLILGYDGAVYDGKRYIYFAPYGDQNGANTYALRYDTDGGFKDEKSWKAVETTVMTDNEKSKGYYGITFDGTYIYYVPFANRIDKFHAMMIRYNTNMPYISKESWEVYDASNIGNENTVGYKGAVYDGRYIYYVPFREKESLDGQHCKVLRYDTLAPFDEKNSWTVYDASNTDGLSTVGYVGAEFDGHYIYFIPYQYENDFHGRVLRYDTKKIFDDEESWNVYDAGNIAGINTKGYKYGTIFNDYLYFAPYNNNYDFSGIVMRYNLSDD